MLQTRVSYNGLLPQPSKLMMSVRFRLPAPSFFKRGCSMFELSLFNSAQFADQGLSILGTFLLTSLSAKTRMYGFIVFILVNIPGLYLLVVTELWWILAVTPVWLYLNYRGFINNYREHRDQGIRST